MVQPSRLPRPVVVVVYLGLVAAMLLSSIESCEAFSSLSPLLVVDRSSSSSSSSLGRQHHSSASTNPTRIRWSLSLSSSSSSSSQSSSSVIIEPGQGTVEQQDMGRGGVRLAQESVIQIVGRFDIETDEIDFSDLFRYTQVTEVDVAIVKSNVMYTGSGIEYYQPAEEIVGTTYEVRYAPMEAVKAALQNGILVSTSNNNNNTNGKTNGLWKRISINFCGGKDAQVLEVLTAGTEFARTLRREKNLVGPSTIIEFRSISDDFFPTETSCVTVVAVRGEDDSKVVDDSTSIAAAIARGEVYRSQATGKYYTLLAEHINTAEE